jgi:hypothetical protein
MICLLHDKLVVTEAEQKDAEARKFIVIKCLGIRQAS